MSATMPAPPVTLDNCDREPIHIPGLVQSHGALIAFDMQGVTTHASANLRELLGPTVPAVGDALAAEHFDADAEVHEMLREALAAERQDFAGQAANAEVRLAGRLFDMIVHRSGNRIVAEFELQPAASDEVNEFASRRIAPWTSSSGRVRSRRYCGWPCRPRGSSPASTA